MTEYSAASPLNSGRKSFSLSPADLPEGPYARNSPFAGTCKAVRASIEQFEAGLDAEHELAMQLVSFGATVTIRPEKVGFTTANVVTFHGMTDEGEKVHLVQHVSQVSMMLKAAKKQHAKPKRVIFQYGGA
jgi:hypothetical protein